MAVNNASSLWVSHSSIGDFLKCQRLYYLHNIYKDEKTRHKVTIINPSLALGQTVHEVLEALVHVKCEERMNTSLLDIYDFQWEKISGRKGGFTSDIEEQICKARGKEMLQRVMDNPGPLINKAVRLLSPDPKFDLPRFTISKDHNIILCGKIDWLEYFPEDNSVHILDFKTGKHEEAANSLQLAIYCLLVRNCQKRKIKKVSYWYLDKDTIPMEMTMPDCEKATERILEIALQMKEAKMTKKFNCAKNGCYACRPYEEIVNGKAEYVGCSSYQDIYVV